MRFSSSHGALNCLYTAGLLADMIIQWGDLLLLRVYIKNMTLLSYGPFIYYPRGVDRKWGGLL